MENNSNLKTYLIHYKLNRNTYDLKRFSILKAKEYEEASDKFHKHISSKLNRNESISIIFIVEMADDTIIDNMCIE